MKTFKIILGSFLITSSLIIAACDHASRFEIDNYHSVPSNDSVDAPNADVIKPTGDIQ